MASSWGAENVAARQFSKIFKTAQQKKLHGWPYAVQLLLRNGRGALS